MWSLHKLNARRPRPDQTAEGERSASPEVEQEQSSFGDSFSPVCPWGFSQDDLERFPALRKRNFWCIQRHQATALHYDLRMQLDGATFSWAIPRGLLGMSKDREANRLAVETSLHPISYTTYEGSDGRTLPSGERGGTLLWDVGTYTIAYPWRGHGEESDSDNERERRRKKRKSQGGNTSILQESNSDDPTGRFEEDKFRQAMTRRIGQGKSRSIHFVLKGGYKMTNHHYILILSPGKSFGPSFSSDGRIKKTWIIRLPKGVEEYPWGPGGEEGKESGRSVKTGRLLKEVCNGFKEGPRIWSTEAERFASWAGDADDEV